MCFLYTYLRVAVSPGEHSRTAPAPHDPQRVFPQSRSHYVVHRDISDLVRLGIPHGDLPLLTLIKANVQPLQPEEFLTSHT